MKIKNTIIFDDEDKDMLKAVIKLIGKTSIVSRENEGLTIKESELCSEFYDSLNAIFEDD